MTLQEILQGYGITRPIDLARVLHIDRRVASLLWRGDRKFSAARALALHDAIGVPIEVLLRAQAVPGETPKGRPKNPAAHPTRQQRRGRPRKRPPGGDEP
jgi:transcriptional regulator with XRE-family HTH domain